MATEFPLPSPELHAPKRKVLQISRVSPAYSLLNSPPRIYAVILQVEIISEKPKITADKVFETRK